MSLYHLYLHKKKHNRLPLLKNKLKPKWKYQDLIKKLLIKHKNWNSMNLIGFKSLLGYIL